MPAATVEDMTGRDEEDNASGGAPAKPDIANPQATSSEVDSHSVENDGTPVENPSG
jgi:hypothetical protein